MQLKNKLLSNVKIDKSTGCWNYGNISNPDLYGYMRVRTHGSTKYVGAHRISYEIFKGEIPSGMFVCHKCDNRHCVNPDHLFLGTCLQNTLDMLSKGRPFNHDGTHNAHSKLTNDQVIKIRALCAEGKTKSEVGRMFEIGSSQICKIVSRKSWKSVKESSHVGDSE